MIFFDDVYQIFRSTKIKKGFFGGFTTRTFGDGRKIELLAHYLSMNELPYQSIVVPKQIHSTQVATLREPINQPVLYIPECDGVTTLLSNCVLSVATADCVPIMFTDQKTNIIGLSHQGWRGTLHLLQKNMIKAMVAQGSKPENITAIIGPAINDCCYTVDFDRYAVFMDTFERFDKQAIHNKHGKYHLSLARLNYLLLLEAGLQPANIDFFPFCTSCDSKRFFSFRKDKLKDGEMTTFLLRTT